VDSIAIVLANGVVIIGKPKSAVSGLGNVRGRGIELASARLFQGGRQVASVGSVQVDGSSIVSIGSRGVSNVGRS
jgi:hypothetical protein